MILLQIGILPVHILLHSIFAYISASKAVDLLMQSKWSSAKGCKTPLFTTRQSCEAYCDR